MSFLEPIILLGLPLAMIPIIIHLLNKLRYKSVTWGAMMFIIKASRTSTSMAKIRQWLVLLLRALAILLLIAALSRPLLGGWLGWTFSGPPDTIIILLDRSATMGQLYHKKDSALSYGLEMLIKSGKEAAADSRIVLINNVDLEAKQIPSWGLLKEIENTKITQTTANISSMYKAALEYILKNPTGVTEIWTLSDMQASNWNPTALSWLDLEAKFKAIPQPLTFKILSLKATKKGNRSISYVRVLSYEKENGIKNYELIYKIISDLDADATTLPLITGGINGKQQVDVKVTGGESLIRYRLNPQKTKGANYGFIQLPPDINPEDNSFFFAYGDNIDGNVLIFTKDTFLGSLFSATLNNKKDNIKTVANIADLDSISLEKISLIIWSGIPPKKELQNKLNHYFKNGGVAIFFPPIESYITNNNNNFNWNKIAEFPHDKPMEVIEWNNHSGPLTNTLSGEPLPLEKLQLYKRSTLIGKDTPPTAFCKDGKPFWYKKIFQNGGTQYFCSTLPLQKWSNLGDGTVLVPIMSRLLYDGEKRFSKIKFYNCGDKGFKAYSAENSPELLLPPQTNKTKNISINCGIYSSNSYYFVINRPLIENIRGAINKDDTKAIFKDLKLFFFDESIEEDSLFQTEIWRWFLIAMFIFLMTESFLLTPSKEK